MPPPAWYPDPSGVGELRYWNGWAWTADVVVGGHQTTRPMPPPPPPVTIVPPPERQLRLPPEATLAAVVGIVVGLGAGIGLSLLGQYLGAPRLARLLVSQAALWTGLLGAVWHVSRRWGTGSPWRDFRLRVGWPEVGWGALMSIAARTASAVVVVPIVLLFPRLAGTNDRSFRLFRDDTASFVAVALLAVVGAPIVEELFFRGVVQGALLDSLGTVGALGLQAVLFGLAHVNPIYGLANITVVAAITAAGVVLGITVRIKGIGASMFAHSLFNLVAVLALAALTR